MFEILCSPMRTANNRWLEIISVLITTHDYYMWFFCSSSFSDFFLFFCGVYTPTHTPTHIQEIQSMYYISFFHILSFSHMNLVCSLLYFSVMVIMILRDSVSLSRALFTTAVKRWRHIVHHVPVKPTVFKQLMIFSFYFI